MAADPEREDLELLLGEGASAQERGDLSTAADLYERALAIDPEDPDAMLLLGVVRWRQGDADAAARHLRRAAERCPWHPQALLHWGRFLLAAGAGREAIATLESLTRLAPDDAAGWSALAEACRRSDASPDRLVQSRAAAERAASLSPRDAEALRELGLCLGAAGEHLAAAAAFERALREKPGCGELEGLLATALANAGDAEQALPHAVAASTAPAADASAWIRLGAIRHALDDTAAATLAFEHAAAIAPAGSGASIVARLSHCVAALPAVPRDETEAAAAWKAFGERAKRLAADPIAEGGIDASGLLQPFHLPSLGGPNRKALSAFGDGVSRAAAIACPGPLPMRRGGGGGRRRIGIVSGLFLDHVVARLFIDGWSSQLDRSRFEVVGFHTGLRRDRRTAELAAQCDRFIEGPRPLAAWAESLREHACDALLYPEIGMDPTAMLLASLRLAPLQAVAWGHPETPGLPTIDAFLTSAAMESPAGASHHREEVVPLPGLGAWIRRPAAGECPPPIAVADRRGLGAGIRLWLAQTPHKLHPRHDRLWGSIAAALPEATVVFASHPGAASITDRLRARLSAAFRASGADPSRQIEIAPRRPRHEHLAALAAATLFLDPPSWSGGQTALEAIALGVPPLTLPGEFLRQRHTLGILRTIDPAGELEAELVAEREADYVEKAVRLARDAERRERLSRRLLASADRAYEDPRGVRALESWLEASLPRG